MKALGPRPTRSLGILELQENWQDWSLELGALEERTVENWAGSGQGGACGPQEGFRFRSGCWQGASEAKGDMTCSLGQLCRERIGGRREEAERAARRLPVRQGGQGQSGGSRGGESGATWRHTLELAIFMDWEVRIKGEREEFKILPGF